MLKDRYARSLFSQAGKWTAIFVVSLVFTIQGLAQSSKEKDSKSAREKELNSASVKDQEAYERLLGVVEKGSITSSTLASINEVVQFRERWWGPGGIAATSGNLSLYTAGGLREAYELRARAKLLQKDHDGALADFALSLSHTTEDERRDETRISETDLKHYDNLFKHISTHKTTAEMMTDIDLLLKKAPTLGVLYMQRSLYQDRPDRTAADLDTALRVSPKVPRIYEVALDWYFQLGDGEKALMVLDKAVKEMPLIFRFHRLRADVLRGDLESGDLNLAVKRLTKVIEECSCQRSRLYFYFRERASVNFLLRNFDAVISDASRAIDITEAMSGGKPTTPLDDPDDWTQTLQPYFYRASAYMAKGMYKEAMPDLNILVEQQGWGSDFQMRAEARCKLGDFQGAKADELKSAVDNIEIKNPCKPK